jgi:hypothetical protein
MRRHGVAKLARTLCPLSLRARCVDPYRSLHTTNDVLHQLLANSVSEVTACVTVSLLLAGELMVQQVTGTTEHCVYSCLATCNVAHCPINESSGLTMLKMLALVPAFRIWILHWKQRGVCWLATRNGIQGFRRMPMLECFNLRYPAMFVSAYLVVVLQTGFARCGLAHHRVGYRH